MIRLTAALLVCAGPALAAPPWQGVYEGVIGASRIIVSLTPEDARYVYVTRPNDLGLIVEESGGALKITETLAPGIGAADVKDNPKLASGLWTLAQQGEKLTGRWSDARGRRGRAISLTRVSKQAEGAGDTPNPGQLGAYSARWLASAPALMPQGGEATFGPLSYTMVRDDLYGNVMPRLTRAPKGVRIDAVNAALEKLHRALVLRDRNCAQNLRSSTALTDPARLAAIEKPAGKGERGAQESIKPVFASASLLTLYETRSQFCGGAHPTNSVAAFTFDLANPRQLAGLGDGGDDLGSSGLGSALDVADPAKRTRFDALWVARFRAAIAADREAHPGDETAEACGSDLDSQLEQSGAGIGTLVYPAKDGLAIHASNFGQAAGVCASGYAANPLVIPWRDIKPFLKPGQKLLPEG